MRSEEEIRKELRKIEGFIENRRREGKHVGGGQYTIAKYLRWVLEEE